VIYLDTHVVLWLYEGLVSQLPLSVRQKIEENELFISPFVELELQYLYEAKRINKKGYDIIAELSNTIGLKICAEPLQKIVRVALALEWTRDPFDRMIVASAKNKNAILLTKDELIRKHYSSSSWD
jgi:PIN domain nuclease of toxin-antitoxin system